MKKVILYTLTLSLLFTTVSLVSCGSDVKPSTLDDRKISTQTQYDSIITLLKLMPEHEHSIFLSPKHTQDYMASAYANQDKFLIEKSFFSAGNRNWQKWNDSTIGKYGKTWTCHINFDTNQTLLPLMTIKRDFYQIYKTIGSIKEDTTEVSETFTFYYIPKLKVGFVVDFSTMNGKVEYATSLSPEGDRDIRNNFTVEIED